MSDARAIDSLFECRNCGYQLAVAGPAVCPECGRKVDPSARRTWRDYRYRRRYRAVVITVLVVVVGAVTWRYHDPLLLWITNPWRDGTPQAFATAQARGRPIVLWFTAEWAHVTSWKRDEQLYREIHFALAFMPVSALKVDVTTSAPGSLALMQQLGVITVPRIMVLDSTGAVVLNTETFHSADVITAVESTLHPSIAPASAPTAGKTSVPAE